MSWEWIETSAELSDVVARYAGAGAVMVDTEFMRRNTFYPQVALVQLCFDSADQRRTSWTRWPSTTRQR